MATELCKEQQISSGNNMKYFDFNAGEVDPTVQRKSRQSLFKLSFLGTGHISIWTSETACRIHCEISKIDVKFERKHI